MREVFEDPSYQMLFNMPWLREAWKGGKPQISNSSYAKKKKKLRTESTEKYSNDNKKHTCSKRTPRERLLFVNESRRDTQHEDNWNELWTVWLVRSKQVTLLPNFVMIPKTKKIHCNTEVSIAILCQCFVKAQTVLVTLLRQGTSCLGHTVVKAQNVLDDIDTGYFIIRLKSGCVRGLTVGRLSVQSRTANAEKITWQKFLRK